MTNLKKAREKGKLEDFIKEHEDDPKGDIDKLEEVIKRPSRESGKATRPTSSRESSDD
jgi:ferritin-like metal-binding protein YciE